jgi:hypothetical protein
LPLAAPLQPQPVAAALTVPFAATAIDLQRHDEDSAWQEAGLTEPFTEPGATEPARPYSIARAMWSEKGLYLSLYAADEDIATATDATRTTADFFLVQIAGGDAVYELEVGPKGVRRAERTAAGSRRPWPVHAACSVAVDGRIDDATGEDDEEWVVFLMVPWADLGLTPRAGQQVRVALSRCDTPKSHGQRCGQWGQSALGPQGVLTLAPAATPTIH